MRWSSEFPIKFVGITTSFQFLKYDQVRHRLLVYALKRNTQASTRYQHFPKKIPQEFVSRSDFAALVVRNPVKAIEARGRLVGGLNILARAYSYKTQTKRMCGSTPLWLAHSLSSDGYHL